MRYPFPFPSPLRLRFRFRFRLGLMLMMMCVHPRHNDVGVAVIRIAVFSYVCFSLSFFFLRFLFVFCLLWFWPNGKPSMKAALLSVIANRRVFQATETGDAPHWQIKQTKPWPKHRLWRRISIMVYLIIAWIA